MSKLNNLYGGKAGQAFAMSEFLIRGWNVAVPEVDVGDDIFVVKDKYDEYSRVQVKTSNGTPRSNGYSASFNLSFAQIREDATPELVFFMLVRFRGQWQKPLIIKRSTLLAYVQEKNAGSHSGDKIIFSLSFQNRSVICSNLDWTIHADDFEDFPVIEH
jgi:hypothetical protein